MAPTTPASGLAVRLADGTRHADLVEKLRAGIDPPPQPLPGDLAQAYKFADALPEEGAVALLRARCSDREGVQLVTDLSVRSVRLIEPGPRP